VASVLCKPLIFHGGPALGTVASVLCKPLISLTGVRGGQPPHTPYALRGAMLARTAGAFGVERSFDPATDIRLRIIAAVRPSR